MADLLYRFKDFIFIFRRSGWKVGTNGNIYYDSVNTEDSISPEFDRSNRIVSIESRSNEDQISVVVNLLGSSFFFMVEIEGSLYLTNDPLQLSLNLRSSLEINLKHLDQYIQSGYVTGTGSLFENVSSFKTGARTNFAIKNGRWVKTPDQNWIYNFGAKKNQSDLNYPSFSSFNILLDQIFRDLKIAIGDQKVLVPLSGGFDSRLILAKLKEHQFNVDSFTYGPSYTMEAFWAKVYSRLLGVKNIRIYTNGGDDFLKNQLSRFLEIFPYFKTCPCLREFEALSELAKVYGKNELPVIINGQAGDYISGGHLLPSQSKSWASSYNYYKTKHWSLWEDLSFDRFDECVKESFKTYSSSINDSLDQDYFWHWFEYHGRQSSYVIGGQHSYDFFGFRWSLPLWDYRICDFFSNLDRTVFYGQRYYKDFCHWYNYKGLFSRGFGQFLVRWNAQSVWVLLIGWTFYRFSSKKRASWYKKNRFRGYYSNQYRLIGFKRDSDLVERARGVVSFIVRYVLRDRFFDRPEVLNRLEEERL